MRQQLIHFLRSLSDTGQVSETGCKNGSFQGLQAVFFIVCAADEGWLPLGGGVFDSGCGRIRQGRMKHTDRPKAIMTAGIGCISSYCLLLARQAMNLL